MCCFKIILVTSVIVGVLLGLWRLIYDKVLRLVGLCAIDTRDCRLQLYFFKNVSEEMLRRLLCE